MKQQTRTSEQVRSQFRQSEDVKFGLSLWIRSTYCVIHAVAEGLVLGEETTRSIRWVGQLRAMDEIAHRSPSTSSSNPTTTRGVPVGKVEAHLAVVAVAFRETKKHFRLDVCCCTNLNVVI